MSKADWLIYNGQVLAETCLLPRGFVCLQGERITSLGEDWRGIEAKRQIDAGGRLIGPGFIDLHTHGIAEVDFMQSDPESVKRGLSLYASFGVTRVLGSTYANPYETIIAQLHRLRGVMQDRERGSILQGVHLEGPWLAPRCRGGHELDYLRTPEKAAVERILGEVGDVIRTVTFSPELPGALWLTERLALAGIVPVLGHTAASFEEAEQAIRAGARHVTHMYDATIGYRESEVQPLVMLPGLETAVLLEDAVSIELIGCPLHVPPPFFRFIDKVKPRDKKVIVTDSLVGTGMPDGSVLSIKGGRQIYVDQGVLRLIDKDPAVNGNFCGSAITMNVALRRLREYARLSTAEAVRWGSLNAATTLGLQRETGSLLAGKLADLIIMDEDFQVEATFVKGRLAYRNRTET